MKAYAYFNNYLELSLGLGGNTIFEKNETFITKQLKYDSERITLASYDVKFERRGFTYLFFEKKPKAFGRYTI